MSFRPIAALALFSLAGCGVDVEANAGPERSREQVFAYTAPMRAGQTVALRNMSGQLSIEPATDDTLRIVADLAWRGDSALPSDVTFRGDTMPGGVLVCAILGDGRCTPDDYDVKSDGTGMSLRGGRLKLGMGGGSLAKVHFRVRVPTGVRLDLVMIDGTIVSASSAPVEAKGVNGDMTIVTSVGPVQAKTVNGNIDARMTTLAGTDSVTVETVNGEVAAYLPMNASATVDVRATNGTVLSDFPGVSGGSQRFDKMISGVLGAGTTPVRVRSINGGASLRQLDAQGRPVQATAPAPAP